MVVTDPDGSNAYVVMGLDQYENLLDHSEASLSDFEGDFEPLGVPTQAIEDEIENNDDLVGGGFPHPHVHDEIPEDLKKAVEADLAIIESWEKARAENEAQESKKNDKGGQDEEQFYLEPVE